MKRLAAVLLVGVFLTLSLPGTGLAYDGIDGTVLDKDGNPWVYGGELYLWAREQGTQDDSRGGLWTEYRVFTCGNGTIDASGNFSFSLTDDPLGTGAPNCDPTTWRGGLAFTELTLTIVFHEGPNGRPRTQDITFHQWQNIRGRYHLGSVTASPTAVSVNHLDAKAASILPPGLPPSLIAILAVIAVVSIAWRRPVNRQP